MKGSLDNMETRYRVASAQAESYGLREVKRAVDSLFRQLGYESQNPLGGLIKPGMTVFIKPTWWRLDGENPVLIRIHCIA